MKKRKNQIKAIIFDIGGVLQLGKYSEKAMRKHHMLSIHNIMANKLKIDLDQWFDSIDSAYAKSIEGKIPRAKALLIISRNLGIDKSKLERLWINAYKKHFKRNKELFRLAKKLKKNKYKIAVLSDQWYLSKEALVYGKDYKIFNKILISCDVKLRKPNPKIYDLILKKLNLKSNQCILIDNQTWNIRPAKKLGFHTILFKKNSQTIKELKKLGINMK